MADDYTGNRNTRGEVIADGPGVPGSIESLGDRDWLRLSLIAGENYQIDVIGVGDEPLVDPFGRLRDNDGLVVASNNNGGPGKASRILFDANATEDYFVQVTEAGNDATGDYSLSVKRLVVDDYTGNRNTNGLVTSDGVASSGSIEIVSDRDWLRVELEEGRTYQIDVAGAGNDPLLDPFARLRDGDGGLIASNNNGGPGKASRIVVEADANGTHFVQVHEAGFDATGDYEVSVQDVTLDLMLIGDSFSIPSRGLPGKLESALEQRGYGDVDIIDLTNSGRQVFGARNAVFDHFDNGGEIPEVVVLAIGINDALNGYNGNPDVLNTTSILGTQLGRIIDRLEDNGVDDIVLAAPESFFPLKDIPSFEEPEPRGLADPGDQALFRQVYIDLAEERDLILADDFIDGLTDDPTLLEVDVFHPNPLGVDRILANILPEVTQAMDSAIA